MSNTDNGNLHFHPSPNTVMEKIEEIKSFYGREDISSNEKMIILRALKDDYSAIGEISHIANMLEEFIGVVIRNLESVSEEEKESQEVGSVELQDPEKESEPEKEIE